MAASLANLISTKEANTFERIGSVTESPGEGEREKGILTSPFKSLIL
jgi:hypothetical protein